MSKRAPKKTWQVTVDRVKHTVTARTVGHAARQVFREKHRKAAKRREVYAAPETDPDTGGWKGVQIECKGAA